MFMSFDRIKYWIFELGGFFNTWPNISPFFLIC
jgi:hypothetical protein